MRSEIGSFTFSAPGGAPEKAENCFQYLLCRLLIGNLAIQRRGIKVTQLTDYSTITPTVHSRLQPSALESFLRRTGASRSNNLFVKRSIAENRPIYHELLLEFSEYFLRTKQEAHTAAFVFLYRSLERISFSFPLIYCSTERDFKKTYNSLKSFFINEKAGELSFLQELIKNTSFIESSIQEIYYTIDYSNLETDVASKYIKQLRRLSRCWEANGDEEFSLKIKFKDIHGLFITIRNRFFHARTGDGQNNLKLSELPDLDDFFIPLNSVFCSYVGFISLETIIKQYTES